MIIENNKVLIGERINKEKSSWQLPGGLISLGETPTDAVIREIKEETNLDLSHISLNALTNNIFDHESHSLSLIFKAKCKNPTTLKNNEKNKCKQWIWVNWEEIPNPKFLPLELLIDSGYHPLKPEKTHKQLNKSKNCFIF